MGDRPARSTGENPDSPLVFSVPASLQEYMSRYVTQVTGLLALTACRHNMCVCGPWPSRSVFLRPPSFSPARAES